MSEPAILHRHLRGLSEPELAEVLALRSDATVPPIPQNLAELAKRLAGPDSLHRSLTGIDATALDLLIALVALGSGTSRTRLACFVGEPATVGTAQVEQALAELRRRALAWPDAEGTLRLAPGLTDLLPVPLNLGSPARLLLPMLTVDQLSAIGRELGTGAPRRKAELSTWIAQRLADPITVRTLVADAPAGVAELLADAAWASPFLRLGYADRSTTFYGRATTPSPAAWAMRRALLIPVGYDMAQLPREVGLALRGVSYTAPVSTAPPSPPTTAADAAAVERQAAAAGAGLLDGLGSLLEMLGQEPVPTLKSGGVGVRESRRLAKTLGRSQGDVELLIELAAAAGLLTVSAGEALPTVTYDQWRTRPPGERLAHVVTSWWLLARTPTRPTGADAKAAPALTGDPGPGVAALRQELIATAAAVPAGRSLASVDSITDTVLWRRPLTYPDRDMAREHLTAAWSEAAALGVVAAGAVTALGRALLTGDGAITEVASNLMPAVRTTATFQSDLTAMVAGTPAAELVDLLGSVADLEARGSATVWRLSPASVRRALDAGATADELLAALGRVSERELPQPLTYLLRDVGRRHGHVAVLPLGSAVVSADAALLAEICASKLLTPFKLRSLAPTVLASAAPVRQTLHGLRAAGYVPVARDAKGNIAVERAPTRRAPAPARAGTARRPRVAHWRRAGRPPAGSISSSRASSGRRRAGREQLTGRQRSGRADAVRHSGEVGALGRCGSVRPWHRRHSSPARPSPLRGRRPRAGPRRRARRPGADLLQRCPRAPRRPNGQRACPGGHSPDRLVPPVQRATQLRPRRHWRGCGRMTDFRRDDAGWARRCAWRRRG